MKTLILISLFFASSISFANLPSEPQESMKNLLNDECQQLYIIYSQLTAQNELTLEQQEMEQEGNLQGEDSAFIQGLIEDYNAKNCGEKTGVYL